MDRNQIKLQARLAVMEYMIGHLHTVIFRLIGANHETIRAIHDQCLKLARERTVPGIDPALSDLWAAEIEDATRSFLAGVEEMVGMDQTPKS